MGEQHNYDNYEYAGFWVRVAAYIIDGLLILVITVPILISIYGVDYYAASSFVFAGYADFFVSFVLPAIAIILFWIYKQATPGKMAIAARIVDARTGEKPSTGQCIGRYFAYIPSVLVLGIGFLWVAFDNRKQGWHDKLAGTVVIKSKSKVKFETEKGVTSLFKDAGL